MKGEVSFCAGGYRAWREDTCEYQRIRSTPFTKRGTRMIIVKNPEACTGCLLCEMVCSFHHIRRYSRSHSSIRVKKSIYRPEKGPQINIFYEKEERNPVCDLCVEEDFALCIRFCPENVLGLERVRA